MNPLVMALILIAVGIFVAYVLVIYGLRDAFTAGEDVNSRLAAYAMQSLHALFPDQAP